MPIGAQILRALRYRNYRLFFTGQGISLVGTWLTRIATSWLVYRLTNSPLALGIVAFAGQIPMLLLAPVAGVVVDRYNRHRILVITQILAMVQSALLALLTFPHLIRVWHVVALSVMQGLINAFDMPARQAFVVEMIEDREDLPNAIALNSSLVNAARLLGPSIGGILIALVGEALCFTIDAVSYIAVVVALLAMRIRPTPPRPREHHLKELRAGLAYSFGFHPIRSILLLIGTVSILGISYTVLMPVFAENVLHGGPKTLGWLMAGSGTGALVGALYLASRKTVIGLGRVIPLMSILFGISLLAFALSGRFWLSLLIMIVSGFASITQSAASNTILQTIVPDQMRGRVMALFGVAFLGLTPFGSLLAGALADRIGPSITVAICGAGCIIAGLLFARNLPELRRHVRPIYVQKGILPQAAEGLGASSTGHSALGG